MKPQVVPSCLYRKGYPDIDHQETNFDEAELSIAANRCGMMRVAVNLPFEFRVRG
jgi:hypothetical protein